MKFSLFSSAAARNGVGLMAFIHQLRAEGRSLAEPVEADALQEGETASASSR